MAIAAVVVLYMYVSGQKDKAFDNAEMVNVWVVHEEVPKGTYGSQTRGMIVKDQIPRKFYPSNAITDTAQIDTKVSVSNLAVNSVVVEGMFADPSTQQVTLANQLKPIDGVQQTAVTISVGDVQGVAGLIVPGDFVNIMATETTSADDGAVGDAEAVEAGCSGASGDLFCGQARVVMQMVQVLAVGTNSIPTPGETTAESTAPPSNTGLITFIVPVESAQMIASIEPSRFYLTLVASDYKPEKTEKIPTDAPLPSEDAEQLTPYGPEGPT